MEQTQSFLTSPPPTCRAKVATGIGTRRCYQHRRGLTTATLNERMTMAAHASTTQRPPAPQPSGSLPTEPEETFPTRFLTMCNRRPMSKSQKEPEPRLLPMAYLRIRGRWLNRAGFVGGTRVKGQDFSEPGKAGLRSSRPRVSSAKAETAAPSDGRRESDRRKPLIQ